MKSKFVHPLQCDGFFHNITLEQMSSTRSNTSRVQSLRTYDLPDTWCDPPSEQHIDNQLIVQIIYGAERLNINILLGAVCQTKLTNQRFEMWSINK